MRNDVKQEFERLIKTQNDKKIELNKTYWVSEWSWNPIADGYITQPEVIRYKETIDGINVYTTGTNYRYYYAWDLYESKEDCKKMSDFKDRFAYGWCETEHYIPHDKIKNILK